MTKKECKMMIQDIRECLDELDFDPKYDISEQHLEGGGTCFDIEIDNSDIEDWPDDYDQQIKDALEDVVSDWGGDITWEGPCISISVYDE